MQTQVDEKEDLRRRRRGCIFLVFGVWFAILGVIVLVMFLVREKAVNREPETIAARARTLVGMEVPPRFQPYSMTEMFGKTVLAFWDQDHVREDGRALAVIAVFRDEDWSNMDVSELETAFLEEAKERLLETDFRMLDHQRLTWDEPEGHGTMLVFRGRQQIGEKLEDATSCYRFLAGAEGPVQVYTLGLDLAFPPEEQIALLKTVGTRGVK